MPNIPEIKFYSPVSIPSLTENGYDVINSSELDAKNYLTQNQTITISGDASGSGNTSISLTLSNTGVTAGTYNSATSITPITIDAKGRITSAGSSVTIAPAWSSITSKPTTISGYGITDAQSLNTKLTSISSLSDSTTGLIKLTNGVASFDGNTYLTSNQTITLSGDATGSGTTSLTVTLANTGVVAGTYNAVTVNSKGLVTGGLTNNQALSIATITQDYNVTISDYVILANGAVTITLPAANSVSSGTPFIIKRISDAGPVTILVSSNGTIDGYTSTILDTKFSSITVVSNGTTWWLI